MAVNVVAVPEISPCMYGQMIFNKPLNWGKTKQNNVFNKWCQENWVFTCKRMELDSYLTPQTKMNSKWTKDLNVRPKSIKPLEENIRTMLRDIELDIDFLAMTTTAPKRNESKTGELHYIKLKNFCASKDRISRVKRQTK